MEGFPFFSIESVFLDWTESGGIIAPVTFDGWAKLCIAIFSIWSIEIRMFAIEYFWAVAGFNLLDAVVCLYHALFCPVHSGRCLAEDIFSLSVKMPDSPECAHVIETDFVFERFWVAHDMPEKFHSLLGESLCGQGAFIFPSVHFLVHPGV